MGRACPGGTVLPGRTGRGAGGHDDGQAVAVLAAIRTPASHPGARPPPGGTWSVASRARARDHATSEFEFHISPPPGGRRPHVSGGTPRTARRIRTTAAASRVTTTGGPTACSRSGRAPCAQQRTSYRNQRERPSGRRPTGPVTTTPPVARRAAPRGGHLDDVRHPVAAQSQRRVEQRAGTPPREQRGGALPRGARAADDVAPRPDGQPEELRPVVAGRGRGHAPTLRHPGPRGSGRLGGMLPA